MAQLDSMKQDSMRRTVTVMQTGYNGLGTMPESQLSYEEQAAPVRQTLRVLNQLSTAIPVNRQPQNFVMAVRASKLSLIRTVWLSDKWGDYAGFDAWINRGARPPVPKVFEEPYELYQLNDE